MPERIFNIRNEKQFNAAALAIFYRQAERNEVYRTFLRQIKVDPKKIKRTNGIPFLPIEFFKTHEVITGEDGKRKTELGSPPVQKLRRVKKKQEERGQKSEVGSQKRGKSSAIVFQSSGTTGQERSRHIIKDITVYEKSFLLGFEKFYGDIRHYCLLALLPSYLENKDSSLVYMADRLIRKSSNKHSGFFLDNFPELEEKLRMLQRKKQKTILLGVSHALVDLSNSLKSPIEGNGWLHVMETGGMKGRKKEMVREALHHQLSIAFGVKTIHSEYGMTELLSQAYSRGNGIFHPPPWMRILVRDPNDYFQLLNYGQSGGINIIDLANLNSCSFIATQDLGMCYKEGSFEVLGRFDYSDLRGCSLLVG